MIRKILLPVDGSDHAAKAAAIAGDIASKYDAEVTILHVLDRRHLTAEHWHMAEVEHMARPGRSTLPWLENIPAELAAMLQSDNATERSDEVLGFLADIITRETTERVREHGVPNERIRVQFRNGNPVDRILEAIDDLGADTVVIGSRGLSEVGGLTFGSVSHKVTHLAPCTVITVK